MPDVVFMAHLEKCQILVFCTHSCSGLSIPNLVCFYNTSWHTQFGVYRVLWPEWQILECSTHPLWCVLYTRCRSANRLCMLQTLLQWILCIPGIYTKCSVRNAFKNHIQAQATNVRACTFYIQQHSPCLLQCLYCKWKEWSQGLEITMKAPTTIVTMIIIRYRNCVVYSYIYDFN